MTEVYLFNERELEPAAERCATSAALLYMLFGSKERRGNPLDGQSLDKGPFFRVRILNKSGGKKEETGKAMLQ